MIGPTDGPPPEPGITTVGPSVGVATNGSVSPMVQDQTTASDRTLEALRVFEPDVVHLHEPLVPGPTSAALLGSEIPKVGTFHAASGNGANAYKALRKIAVGAASASTCASPSAPTRGRWRRRRSAARTCSSRTASTSTRTPRSSPRRRPGPR